MKILDGLTRAIYHRVDINSATSPAAPSERITMSKIYVFGNSKGGVGKSTLAVQAAIGLSLPAYPGAPASSVWFVDGDEQSSGLDAITMRAQRGEGHIDAACYHKADVLRTQVRRQSARYDFTIIDVGGNDNGALRAALTLADALIVPFKPRGFDTWALAKFDALMLDVLGVRDDLDVYALLNEADSSGGDNEEAIASVAEFPYMKPLQLMIGDRKVIPTASTTGRYVAELATSKASVQSAINEINTLVSMLRTGEFDVRPVEAA
jgi:chromosome partitioning protein